MQRAKECNQARFCVCRRLHPITSAAEVSCFGPLWRQSASPQLFTTKQWAIITIVFADKFVDSLQVGTKRKGSSDRPGLGENVRIFDRRFVLDRIKVRTPELFDHVKTFRRPDFNTIQYEATIEDPNV